MALIAYKVLQWLTAEADYGGMDAALKNGTNNLSQDMFKLKSQCPMCEI